MQTVSDLKIPIGKVLEDVGADGLLLEAEHQTRYAVLPLDDDLLDYLLERNPQGLRHDPRANADREVPHAR